MEAFTGHARSTIRGIVGEGSLSGPTEARSRGRMRPFNVEGIAAVGDDAVSFEVIISWIGSGSGTHLKSCKGSVGFDEFA